MPLILANDLQCRCSTTIINYLANVQHRNVIANQLAQRSQLEQLLKVTLDGQRRVDTVNLPSSAVQRNQTRTLQRRCEICGRESLGSIHFGGESCEACCAFFRRTVVLGKAYVCLRGEDGLPDHGKNFVYQKQQKRTRQKNLPS
ncbi:unnamed protein product, partial [Mesorhabditis spiculigera]